MLFLIPNRRTQFIYILLVTSRGKSSISRALKDLIGVVDCQNKEGNLLFKDARVNRGLHLLFMSNEITVI